MKKPKFCPGCGSELKNDANFCEDCGYKIVIEETVEDKKGHIRKAQEIIESDSPIQVPSHLTLMPGERLLEKHIDFYVSNKRLIKHTHSFLKTETKDYHFRHIKGVQNNANRYFLVAGLIIGIIGLLMGFFSSIFFVIGAIIIILAFWLKTESLIIQYMDGDSIEIPKIKSKSGQKLAHIIRTQLYN